MKSFRGRVYENKICLENTLFEDVEICMESVFNVDLNDLRSGDRGRKIVDLRIIFSYMCRCMGIPLISVAERINRDHSTIVYYLGKYDDLYDIDADFRSKADRLSEMLKYK